MRNMIRADLRRVFRKQIFWIIPLIALLFGLSTMISMLAVEFLSKIIPQLGLLAQQKNAALASINTVMDSLKLALSIVIFLALFVDDFKSMSMTQMIGYGMSRKKIVLSKFIDSVILSSIFYVVLVPVLFLLFSLFHRPLTGEYASFVLFGILFGALKTIASVTIAALVLYLTNNMAMGIFALLILQILPVGLQMMSASPAIRVLHLDRYFMDGMFGYAHTNFILGLVPEGIFWTILCVVIYIGLVLAGTIIYFDRKELDL
jgi:hypothetical protein